LINLIGKGDQGVEKSYLTAARAAHILHRH
jgi:hypothetical protein